MSVEKCKCSMTVGVLGDGCSICNPEYWASHEAEILGAEARYQGVRRCDNPYKGAANENDWLSGWDDAEDEILMS